MINKPDMDIQNIILTIAKSLPGLLLAIVAHEWAHGFMAKKFGDDTAEREGRLTLNPAAHIDVFGTLIVPLMCVMFGGLVFGWAKPVPIVPRNFKDVDKGIFWVSFAGPLMNFILGISSAILFAVFVTQVPDTFSFYSILAQMLQYSVLINFVLGAFNLIPLPPLDGSNMLSTFLKGEMKMQYLGMARYANFIFMGIFALSMVGIPTIGYLISPVVMIGQKLSMYFLYLLG